MSLRWVAVNASGCPPLRSSSSKAQIPWWSSEAAFTAFAEYFRRSFTACNCSATGIRHSTSKFEGKYLTSSLATLFQQGIWAFRAFGLSKAVSAIISGAAGAVTC